MTKPGSPAGPGPGSPNTLGFSKAQRLLKQAEFSRVFKQGRRQSQPEMTLAWRLRNNAPGRVFPPRLGLSVSRKVGNAVKRNLLKRRLREIFRLNQHQLLPGAEIVFIPRQEASKLSYFSLEKLVFGLLKRGKLMRTEKDESSD